MGPAFPHVCVQGGRHLVGCRGGCSIAHTPPGFCHELNVCVRKTLEELQLASGTWGGKISGVRVLTSAGKEWQKKVGRSWRCSWLGEIAVCVGGWGAAITVSLWKRRKVEIQPPGAPHQPSAPGRQHGGCSVPPVKVCFHQTFFLFALESCSCSTS